MNLTIYLLTSFLLLISKQINAVDNSCEADGLHYQCLDNTKKCIPIAWLCDQRNDCENGDDENSKICEPRGSKSKVFERGTCLPRQFECEDLNGMKKCILEEWRCDGHVDCKNGLDEEDCDLLQKPETQLQSFNIFENPLSLKCSENQFLCKTIKECLPTKKMVCDGRKNCLDGSDEMDCTEETSSNQNTTTGSKLKSFLSNITQKITSGLSSTPILPLFSSKTSNDTTISSLSTLLSTPQQSTSSSKNANNNITRIQPTVQTRLGSSNLRILRGSTEVFPISPKFAEPVSAHGNKPLQVSMHRIAAKSMITEKISTQTKLTQASTLTTSTLTTMSPSTIQPVVFVKRENVAFQHFKSIGNLRPIVPQL